MDMWQSSYPHSWYSVTCYTSSRMKKQMATVLYLLTCLILTEKHDLP
jgi:hypothetical protein